MSAIESTPEMAAGVYATMERNLQVVRRRLARPLTLADKVLLSRSGLTRLVDRLQAEGLVTREPYPGDARGLYTVLTQRGLDRLREAAPIHLAGVQQYWLSKFDDDELRELHEMLSRLDAVPADESVCDDDNSV